MIYNIQTFKLQSERIAYPGLIDAVNPCLSIRLNE